MQKMVVGLIFLFSSRIFAENNLPVTFNARLNPSSFSDSQLIEAHLDIGNPDFMVNYFFKPEQSFGFGVDAYITTESLSLWSWRVGYKNYFLGQGYPTISKGDQFTILQSSKHASYLGVEVKNYHYFISSEEKNRLVINNENIDNNGNYYNVNLLVGYEYHLNAKYALNLEVSQAIMAISASDERISTKASVFLFGLVIKL